MAISDVPIPGWSEKIGAMTRMDFHDHESGSAAFATVGRAGERVTLGFGVESNGDLDVTLTADDAKALADAINSAAKDAV